jgi:hypothetical protein
MKKISDFINEASINRAKEGAVLEVELVHDGNFYWVTDEEEYSDMEPWEFRIIDDYSFVIKIGKLKK